MSDALESLHARFAGDRGKQLLLQAVMNQTTVLGNEQAAQELCARGKLKGFDPAEFLMKEGEWTNTVFFILAGRVEISIMGNKVADRGIGQHVGEMALIDPAQPRSASATALDVTLALELSEEHFAAVASKHPDMWRQLAKEIADRLRQRRKFVRPTNSLPIVFIASAGESLSVAKALRDIFETRGLRVDLWAESVFKPSVGTMESLEKKLEIVDFAVAVFSGDDIVESRGEEKLAPRDNTVFELGLFAGAIGRQRSFFVVEKGKEVKVPSDLAGITSLRFEVSNGKPEIENACEQIADRIAELGPR